MVFPDALRLSKASRAMSKVSEKTNVNVECYRNGKTVSASGSLKNGQQVESEYVKVEYDKSSKLPMLNVRYE
ncbi:hypothetical protein [Providencia rustigianii]|uniref:hypothetical protein n=1 Tax=Providencia rustigianii TaxID=158850 RepID=UPI0039064B70